MLNVRVLVALGFVLAGTLAACSSDGGAPSSPESAFVELRVALATGRPDLLEGALGPRSRAWLADRTAALAADSVSPLSVSWVASANDIASIERSEASFTSVVLMVSFHSGAVARVPLSRVDGRWVFELPALGEGNSDG